MTSKSRESIISKIKALRAKTTDNGCTEAEAMAAMAMMAKLMDQYQVDEADVEDIQAAKYGVGKHTMGKKSEKSRRATWHPTMGCWVALGRLAHCKVWVSDATAQVHAFGEAEDVATLWYYMDLVRATFDQAWADHRKLDKGASRASFAHGFARRVNEAVKDIVSARDAAIRSMTQERGLMVQTKGALLRTKYEAYLAANNLRLKTRGGGGRITDSASYGAGSAAGSRVSFGRSQGVGGGSRRLGS